MKESEHDSVKIVRVGDTIVLMIQVFPTAFMLALDEASAAALSEGLLEAVVTRKTKDSLADMLGDLMKKKGEPS